MIEAEGVAKRYGKFQALHDFNLRVEEGEVFGLLGPNGAGKSTMTKIFCGLLEPSEGRASIGGHDLVKETTKAKRLIGYLPERVPVYKTMTAREDLSLFARLHGIPSKERAARIDAALERVNLKGVDGRAVGGFSKGMTQRLGIARALLHDPKVVFFDEPASGLDPTGRREIRALLQDLSREKRTVFLCSHDLAEVQAVCKRIGFLRQGQLVKTMNVGDAAAEGEREFRIELAGKASDVADKVRALQGVVQLEADGANLLVRSKPTLDRVMIAKAIIAAGGLHLDIRESTPTIDALYRAYIEDGQDVKA